MELTDLVQGARTYLRDFPNYFEVEQGPLNVLTIRLPHPLVAAGSLTVYLATEPVPPATEVTTTVTTAWELDERNGLLKLTDTDALGKRVLVSGYHYTWFADADLSDHVLHVAREHMYNRPYITEISHFGDVEADVVLIGGLVHALWSLLLELALDIDVSTPEGMFIPARQRYQQVLQMMQYWENEYNSRAAALNVGLNALEQFQLRRVSKLTGRYVPVYRPREFDDPRPPKRLYPPIPVGTQGSRPPGEMDVIDVYESANPDEWYYNGQDIQWRTVGTNGDPDP